MLLKWKLGWLYLSHTDFSLDGYVCSMTKGPKARITQTVEPQAVGPASLSYT